MLCLTPIRSHTTCPCPLRSDQLATRIQNRATQRCGELLQQIEPAQGAHQNIRDGDDLKVLTRTDAAAAAGLSERQRKTALRVANVPEDLFEELVESDDPPSVTPRLQSVIHSPPVTAPPAVLG